MANQPQQQNPLVTLLQGVAGTLNGDTTPTIKTEVAIEKASIWTLAGALLGVFVLAIIIWAFARKMSS